MLAMAVEQGNFFFLTVDSDEAEGVNINLAVFAESMNLSSDRPKFFRLDFTAGAPSADKTPDQEYNEIQHRAKQTQ